MKMVKCVGCLDLRREELEIPAGKVVVYNCPRFFPHPAAVSGLLRPGAGIAQAVLACPERIDERCILCSEPAVSSYGEPEMAFTCKQHDRAWREWMDAHPEKRAYIRPRQRIIRGNWIEVFREFIEDMRDPELIAAQRLQGVSEEKLAEELNRFKPKEE